MLLDQLRERLKEIPQADARRLQELKNELLGRKAGALTEILKGLPTLAPAERKAVGGAANALKQELETAFAARERALAHATRAPGGLDRSMPGRAAWQGGLHLVTQVVDEICDIFRELGFTRAVGPEAETERYNFFALNFPKDHPALDAQDSFYLGDGVLLRTHTSPVQIRTLERYAPPIRVVLPVHRAVGRDGRAVSDLRRGGLHHLQADGLDGDPRLGDGASRRARELRRLERALLGLCLGHGAGAHRDDAPRHRRHPAAVRERRALPGAVRGWRAVIVSRRWLEALLGRPLDAREVAEQLTMHVAAVDAVVPLHQDLGDVLIGRVLEVKKHPNADRLSLCRVDAGGAEPVDVVCGAPNVQAGKTYPYAPIGATLPGGVKLERRKIRGVESNGMLCSAKELGLGEDHAGILELDTTAPPGSRFLDVVPVADHQIVIDVPANRPDLLCHKGVARELAAVLGGTVKLPPISGAGSAATAAEGGVPAGRSRASSAGGGEAARAGG